MRAAGGMFPACVHLPDVAHGLVAVLERLPPGRGPVTGSLPSGQWKGVSYEGAGHSRYSTKLFASDLMTMWVAAAAQG